MMIQVEGRPVDMVVRLGQYILIEGDDDDNPYVARLLKFYCDGKLCYHYVMGFKCTVSPL